MFGRSQNLSFSSCAPYTVQLFPTSRRTRRSQAASMKPNPKCADLPIFESPCRRQPCRESRAGCPLGRVGSGGKILENKFSDGQMIVTSTNPLACTPAVSTADPERRRRSLLLSRRDLPGRHELRSGPPRMGKRNHSEIGILFVADMLEPVLFHSSANRANPISDYGAAFRVARGPSGNSPGSPRPIACGGLCGLYAESSHTEEHAGRSCAFPLNLDFKTSRRARQSPG